MRTLIRVLFVIVSLLLVLQVVPYGREHPNPPVVGEVTWDSLETKALFARACADCHSHETKWPWYSNIAPISWLVTHDVFEGREHFNISTWGIQAHNEGHEAAEEVKHGKMPLSIYLPLHPEAQLTEVEKEQLVAGLKATFGADH